MTLAEVAIVFGFISTGVVALAGFLTAMAALRKSKADAVQALAAAQKALAEAKQARSASGKSDADIEHTVVDTAADLIAQIKSVYESRILQMESKIRDLESGRKQDCEMIISLTKQLGIMRQTAELQSKQIQLWRSRVEELLSLLRRHEIVLPDWAHPAEEGENVGSVEQDSG